jgi:glycerol-3-phosphate dehydrogenase (NAD(P)+)
MRVAVVGAGSWGTAFATLVGNRGVEATLICRRPEAAEQIARERRNDRYLPGVALPDAVRVSHLAAEAPFDGAEIVVLAVPSRATAETVDWLVPRLRPGVGLLSLTKGLDPQTGGRLSEVWRARCAPSTPFAMLSGPNHAEEVVAGQPTATVVAGDAGLCESVQHLLNGRRFRVYVNDDLLGVELCAAAKNVVAIAAGISDGLGFGDNAKASLMTRGLAEMTRLGTACGARADTFRGLAGMGDLVATCTSPHSRNRRAGELIARGTPVADVEGALGQVAEGLWTVHSLLGLAARVDVELPISVEVAAVLDGKPIPESMDDLMARAPVSER